MHRWRPLGSTVPLAVALVAVVLWPGPARAVDDSGYELSLRTELQGRVYSTGGLLSTSLPILVTPSVTGIRRLQNTTLRLNYAPQLQVYTDGLTKPLFLHNGSFLLQHFVAPARSLALNAQGSYGSLDFGTLNSIIPGRLQPVPTFVPIPYGSINVDGTWDWLFNPRTRALFTATYYYGGGIGPGEAILPLQKSEKLVGAITTTTSKVDSFVAQPSFSRTELSTGAVADIGVATEQWTRRISPTLSIDAALGVSVAHTTPQVGVQPYGLLYYPAALFAAHNTAHSSGNRFDIEALATLSPYFDWITGVVYERTEASLLFRWTDVGNFWVVNARVRGATSVAGSQPVAPLRIASLELTGAYNPQPNVRVELGSRFLYETGPDVGNVPYFEWLTFLSFTVTQRGIL